MACDIDRGYTHEVMEAARNSGITGIGFPSVSSSGEISNIDSKDTATM